eukprot:jgi/Chlat1/4969/Chrsp32S08946
MAAEGMKLLYYLPPDMVRIKAPQHSKVDFYKVFGKKAARGNADRDKLLSELTELRVALAELLAEVKPLESVTAGEYMSKLNDYLARFRGFVDTPSNVADAAPSAADASPAPSSSEHVGNSSLRYGAHWSWNKLYGLEYKALPQLERDAQYEITSMLIGAAGWHLAKASSIARNADTSLTEAQSKELYAVLRVAAGLYGRCATNEAPLLGGASNSTDVPVEYRSSALQSLQMLCLAEAQGVSIGRAFCSGHDVKLISSLSIDTANMYAESSKLMQTAAPADSAIQKHVAYCAAKSDMYNALAHAAFGRTLLAEEKCGDAVACGKHGAGLIESATVSAKKFDRIAPASKQKYWLSHYYQWISKTVANALRDFERQNSIIYFAKVPAVPPELGAARRVAKEEPYFLPQHDARWTLDLVGSVNAAQGSATAPSAPAHVVLNVSNGATSEAPAAQSVMGTVAPPASAPAPSAPKPDIEAGKKPAADAEKQEKKKEFSCWRCLLLCIASPALLLISLIGIVIWILLLPVKIICCPIGCVAQLVVNVFEEVVKLPFKALEWAAKT